MVHELVHELWFNHRHFLDPSEHQAQASPAILELQNLSHPHDFNTRCKDTGDARKVVFKV